MRCLFRRFSSAHEEDVEHHQGYDTWTICLKALKDSVQEKSSRLRDGPKRKNAVGRPTNIRKMMRSGLLQDKGLWYHTVQGVPAWHFKIYSMWGCIISNWLGVNLLITWQVLRAWASPLSSHRCNVFTNLPALRWACGTHSTRCKVPSKGGKGKLTPRSIRAVTCASIARSGAAVYPRSGQRESRNWKKWKEKGKQQIPTNEQAHDRHCTLYATIEAESASNLQFMASYT